MPTNRRSRKPSKGTISPRDLVANNKRQYGPAVQRKGIFEAEAVLLLCKKVGISDKEIKEIAAKSIRHNKEMARRFDEAIAKSSLNHDAIMSELSRAHDFAAPFAPQNREYGVPGWIAVPPLGGDSRSLQFRAEGAGGGALTSTFTDQRTVTYTFEFTPSFTGIYFFRAPFFAVGSYYLIADDGPCEDKYAQLGIDVGMGASQAQTPIGGSPRIKIFQKKVTNEAISDLILFGQKIDIYYAFLTTGLKVSVTIILSMQAIVSGGGSIVSVDLGKPAGTIWCPHLEVGGLQFQW